jgi:TRAP-type uncharacterized transport system substrate-binding protein
MSLIHRLSTLALVVAAIVFGEIRPTAAQSATAVNRGVVELETTGSTGISVRIAEDFANLIDDGSTRRLLPVIGKGSLQNVTDLKYLRGIDIAILQADVLDFARDQRLLPGLESSITYITKLYNEEFHLLARSDIRSIADLENQNVNLDLRSSGTAITASRVFDALKLKVNPVYDSQQVALEKLRRGEIAAIAFVAGKPAPLFGGITETDRFHLLDVPYKSTPTSAYAPTRLTSTDYPLLVPRDRPVDTIAVGSILAAADLRQIPDRYQNTVNFIDAFFTGFQSLLGPGYHPKWQEVSLAAEVPGWRRHPAAEQWLQRNLQVSRIPDPEVLKGMFSQFIDQRRQAAHGEPMTEQEKAALFQQFQVWRDRQGR